MAKRVEFDLAGNRYEYDDDTDEPDTTEEDPVCGSCGVVLTWIGDQGVCTTSDCKARGLNVDLVARHGTPT